MWELEVIVQNEILRASPQVQTGLTPHLQWIPKSPCLPEVLLPRGLALHTASDFFHLPAPAQKSCSKTRARIPLPMTRRHALALKGSCLAPWCASVSGATPHFPCSSNLLSHPAGDLGPDGGGEGGGVESTTRPSSVILQGEMLSRSEPLALAAQLRASGQLLVSSSIEASCLQQGCDGALGAQEKLLPSPRHEVWTDLQYPLTILPDTTFRNGSQDLGSPSTGAPRRTTSSMIPWQSGERVQQSLSVFYATVGPDGRG